MGVSIGWGALLPLCHVRSCGVAASVLWIPPAWRCVTTVASRNTVFENGSAVRPNVDWFSTKLEPSGFRKPEQSCKAAWLLAAPMTGLRLPNTATAIWQIFAIMSHSLRKWGFAVVRSIGVQLIARIQAQRWKIAWCQRHTACCCPKTRHYPKPSTS